MRTCRQRRRLQLGTPKMLEFRGLECPSCSSVRVVAYHTEDGYRIRRRLRHCQNCGHNFATIEVTAELLASIWPALAEISPL